VESGGHADVVALEPIARPGGCFRVTSIVATRHRSPAVEISRLPVSLDLVTRRSKGLFASALRHGTRLGITAMSCCSGLDRILVDHDRVDDSWSLADAGAARRTCY